MRSDSHALCLRLVHFPQSPDDRSPIHMKQSLRARPLRVRVWLVEQAETEPPPAAHVYSTSRASAAGAHSSRLLEEAAAPPDAAGADFKDDGEDTRGAFPTAAHSGDPTPATSPAPREDALPLPRDESLEPTETVASSMASAVASANGGAVDCLCPSSEFARGFLAGLDHAQVVPRSRQSVGIQRAS